MYTCLYYFLFTIFSYWFFKNFVPTSFPECLLFLFSFSVVYLEGILGYEINPDYNIGSNLYALLAVIF